MLESLLSFRVTKEVSRAEELSFSPEEEEEEEKIFIKYAEEKEDATSRRTGAPNDHGYRRLPRIKQIITLGRAARK